MKRLLTIVAIFMSMLCGSVFLVSCSNDYKKMYLVVEYALPTGDGSEVEWRAIDSSFDYYLSDDVYSNEEMSHVLYLRVRVKGTKKKINSLYVSQSVNNSTFLENDTIKPNEAFKVLVKNIGSVKFTVTPSQGGEDKIVSFGVNIYKQLTGISQNINCVPAVVTGGYVRLESLTNLIEYKPLNETNQTGVDFSIEGIGTLDNNGSNNLIGRDFIKNQNYDIKEDSDGTWIENKTKPTEYVNLYNTTGALLLNVSAGYGLTHSNNVIHLIATSRYDAEITTDIYVYIVENFTSNSLLVSYSDSIVLDGGKIPTSSEVSQAIDDNIVIYNSTIGGDGVYNSVSMYTYTNTSIYSYESNPGIKLNVFINGVEYNYNDVVNNNFGIQVTPVYKDVLGENKLIGLKFEVNPNSTSNTNKYNVRLELDFTAFDFTASDKAPVSVLNKKFVITVENLASGFHINGKGYNDNLKDLANNIESTITAYNSTQPAKLYSTYSVSAIGMPLNIQATPTNAVDTNVRVGFYESCEYNSDTNALIKGVNLSNKLQLFQSIASSLAPNGNGQFEIDFNNKNKVVYLRFNENANVSGLEYVYMVCEVTCTPDTWKNQEVKEEYITFVAKIKVIGSVDNIFVYKDLNGNKEYDDKYIATGVNNIAYINFSSSSIVDLTEIEISSLKGDIKYSVDGKEWVSKLTAEKLGYDTGSIYKNLYFRTDYECTDSVIISSPNGISVQTEYQFVNVVSSSLKVELKFDKTYIEEFSTIDKVGITDVTAGENVDLKYLALQSGRNVQFKAFGDNKNNTIKNVNAKSLLVSSIEYDRITKGGNRLYSTAISSFSASAIKVSNGGKYVFDISANSVGFTAILFVKVDFYILSGSEVVEQSKYFIYEVAVYTPARELIVKSDKDSIIYINENYHDTSMVDFVIGLNSATKTISFSSSQVNESINLSYGSTDSLSIYGISVQPSENVLYAKDNNDNPYFKVNNLNTFTISYINENGYQARKDETFVSNNTRSFSVQALKSLKELQAKGVNSISFDVVIYQFGKEIETTKVTKVIGFGSYTPAEIIVIESGVESYSNIYLSLLSGATSHVVKAYVTSESGEVTYKELGYKLYQYDKQTNTLIDYKANNLTVTHDNLTNSFEINANTSAGGVYQLILYSKDSYDENKKEYVLNTKITITVSDGKTSDTAYLIKNLDDFVTLAENTEKKHYRLWQDIDISALSDERTTYYSEWWNKERKFSGYLYGAISIEDPNTGNAIYRRYSLIGLRVENVYDKLTNANCFGLFNIVTGMIENVVFDNVVIDITLDNTNTAIGKTTNIGVITAINNGEIKNCSVNIAGSSIIFETSAQNITYNIGLVAGLNNNIIYYENSTTGSNYSHIVDSSIIGNSAGKLTIEVVEGNTNFTTANLYIGGVAGQNASGATISSDYADGSSKNIRELITAVVNIELKVKYKVLIDPIKISAIDLGGIAGFNAGTITKIAVSGSLVANDKVNIGGVVGENTGIIEEVANYGAYIEGYSWNNTLESASKYTGMLTYHGSDATQEQNVGGIIGFNNAGMVDNVRVMFITFTKDEISIASSSAEIKGLGNVAGIIGKAVDTQLKRGYVENFIVDEDELTYNIIGNKANVAGLIANSSSSSAVLSFVQADFDVRNCDFYEFGKELEEDDYTFVYFIGDVLTSVDKLTVVDGVPFRLNEHNGTVQDSSYIINNLVYVDNQGKIAKKVVTYGLPISEVSLNKSYEKDEFTIQWNKSDEEGVNDNQPYLIYIIDGKVYYTLTVQPTSIIVNVDENYFDEDAVSEVANKFEKYEDGLYLQYVDNNNTPTNSNDDRVVATAVVYYIEGANNTHYLVSSDARKGLIEKTIIPTIANGTYTVSIISGSSIATLTDGGSTITFSGVGKVELKFASLFDRTKTDIVTIFVENPLHDDVFDITTSSGLEDKNQDGTRFTTMVNVNSLLSLNLKNVDNQTFDSAKTYMRATIGSAKAIVNGVSKDIVNIGEYFTLSAITEEISTGSKNYLLGQFNIETKELDKTYKYIEVTVTLSVYLNTANYYIGETSLNELMDTTSTLIKEKTITIIVYNKASELTVSSDVKAEAGEDIDIVSQLTTGYVDESKLGEIVYGEIVGEGAQKLFLSEIVGFDKIEAILTPANKNAQDLLQQAKDASVNPNTFSVWDLFDRVVTYKLFNNKRGYTYSINLRLNENYRYLDLTDYTDREWKFNINIVASSNTALSKNVVVSFVPQSLIGFRLENYSNLVARAGETNGTSEAEFVSNQPESSLIIPGESGLIKIFADYSYSYFEDVTISSSRVSVNGKEYFIRYQQMIYNKNKEVYESYAGITADGESLTLKKVSYRENGEYKYEGVLFVRTILDEIVGVKEIFTITVSAKTYDLDGNVIPVSRTKTVISQYRPGVYISVSDTLMAKDTIDGISKTVYLVEENSSVSTIVARVYGYEFNVQPIITISAFDTNETIFAHEVSLIKYGEVEKDETGAYIIRYRLAVNTTKRFKVSMKMTLIDNGNALTDRSEELFFYPVPYIINSVYVKGEANGILNIPVNSSRGLDLVWSTKSTTNDKINSINTKINDSTYIEYLKLYYIEQINGNGQDEKKYFSEYLNAKDTSFTIKQNANGTYRIESLIKVAPITVHFDLWYGYKITETGVQVEFSNIPTTSCNELLAHTFRLQLTMQTSEDAPNPINTAEDLMSMAEGENYILMEDITLENWTPLTTAIASLDGNSKVINIKSFNIAVTNSLNVGIFATVNENTILKNIVVNIASMGNNSHVLYIKDEGVINSTINFGLLAGVNNGLIYNCEVISISNTKLLEVVVGTNYNLTFGALVGVNNGNITNSRVGTEYFQRLEYVDGLVVTARIPCGQLYFKAKGIVAGFVGQNNQDCIISSSFVANTSVENISNSGDSTVNRTAGFVATNNGTIAYSYVKGLESNILTTKSTTNSTIGGAECVIYASGSGSVAGFVYMNTGTVHDCYSNTICKSNSAGVAGFVYNTTKGTLYQCYSASKVESGNTNTALATELPFVGVGIDKNEAQQLLSNKDMINCYYLDDGTEFDDNYKTPNNEVEPKGLSLEGFATSSNLANFSFISDSTSEQQLNGVWTYSTAVDSNRTTYPLSITALPELTSANTISRSIRVYADAQSANSEIKEYKYPEGYGQGDKINPYIIRNIDEYQSVFVEIAQTIGQTTKNTAWHVRFVDDISFNVNGEYIDINTRSNYILGDKNNNRLTLIDGNGMSISGVVINHSEDEKGKLGLFSEVYYSVIKGLNIQYSTKTNSSSSGNDANQGGSTTASYVGGVAGTAKNTYFIDLNLTGNVTLRANNVVGGVVGRLTGSNSGLYNITTNLNVQAGNKDTGDTYVDEDSELNSLSYAGGIAGIIDIGRESSNENNFNLNKLTVNASSVRANRAGGIAGFIGKNANAKCLTYIISNTSQVFGHEVAGGIVADNYANIQLSEASYEDDKQYEFDKAFAQYINNENIRVLDNKDSVYGNLRAVTGEQIVGGFVGINYYADITNSLTKANIGYNSVYGMSDTIGGFIGKAYGGDLKYVYAQNYIDLIYKVTDADQVTTVDYPKYVGGLIGYIAYDNTQIETNNPSKYIGLDNVVSTNWFDKTQVDEFYTKQQDLMKNDSDKDGIKDNIYLDYVVANIDIVSSSEETGTIKVGIRLKSDQEGSVPIINYGVFNADANNEGAYDGEKIQSINTANAQYYNMEELYYIPTNNDTAGVSTQQDIFNTLFAVWPDLYWYKEYTRFMPNLKDDDSVNYIEIADEGDIKKLEESPDKSFILVKDIDITEETKNYIVDADFRGILISKLDENGEPYTINIKLTADTVRGTGAGFFRQTTGARISNINFHYNELTLAGGGEYKMVGGVSAVDTSTDIGKGSRFENVIVTSNDDAVKTKSSAVITTVKTLGSIVGEGTQSKIISCTSSMKYKVNTASEAKIGGLVGTLNGYYYDEEEKITRYEGLITSSKYEGKITVNGEGSYIGGLVAEASYTNISSSTTRHENEGEYDPNVEILVNNKNNNYIGGIVATYNMCSIISCYAEINVQDNEIAMATAEETSINTTYHIGGIAGEVRNDLMMDKDIEDCYSRLTVKIVKTDNLNIGGIICEKATEQPVTLNKIVSEITINKITYEGNIDVADRTVVGGIVAVNSENIIDEENCGLTINHSMAIMNCDIDYNNTLLGGGLIGQSTGSYWINNSTAMGFIKANNLNGKHMTADSTSTLTVLGGLVGLAGEESNSTILTDSTKDGVKVEQQIDNSYSALTLSTAKVYKGKVGELTHNVYTNAIVGYTDTHNQIEGKGVFYSSDYTLTFENGNKFKNRPINVTANVLINNEDCLKSINSTNLDEDNKNIKGKMGEAWFWKDDHLPLPSLLQDILIKMGIFEIKDAGIDFVSDSSGTPYSPKIIHNQSEFKITDDNYNYYLLLSDINITSSSNNLNGVLLGNNHIISSSGSMFGEIKDHSAVSNLTFKLDSSFSNAVVAVTNNGTVFMCGVQYDSIGVSNFAGIVSTNNGNISYCYNVGNSDTADDNSSGLVQTNEDNASIENSYFTGSFAGGIKGSALVHTNNGYISNSYSGGMASKVITINKETSRYENVYYDYNATYITTSDYEVLKEDGLVGESTINLQGVNGEADSKLFDGWKVYSMHNWNTIKNSTNENVTTTYNYGYPIHDIKQLVYINANVEQINANVEQIPLRIKQTGNGTFAKIVDGDGNAVIDSTDEGINHLKSNTKGKLVYDDTLKEYYDNVSFLINNLGVLSLINEVSVSAGEDSWLATVGLYFELEVNIELPDNTNGYKGLVSNWKGLGSETNPFRGVFTTTPSKTPIEGATEENIDYVNSSNGLSYYRLNRVLLEEIDAFSNISLITQNSNPKTITNLRGGALFAHVESGAVIANITLEDSVVNNAPFINTVGSNSVSEDGSVTMYNTNINRLKVNENAAIAGFVNKILEDKTLNMYSVAGNESEIVINAYNEHSTKNALSVVGAINENNGTLNVRNSFKTTIKVDATKSKSIAGFVKSNKGKGAINVDGIAIKLIAEGHEITSVSGFALENSGSILATSDSTITLSNIGTTDTLAGLIGTMSGGGIGGFNIVFEGESNYQTKTFGGVVAKMQSGQIGKVDETISIITVELKTVAANTYGGVVGEVNKTDTSLTVGGIANVVVKANDNKVTVTGNEGSESAYGLIIGKYLTELSEINYTLDDSIIFNVNNGNNVGGIIGLASNGTFKFTNGIPKLTRVHGANNVGGFIGLYNGTSSLTIKAEYGGKTWVIGDEAYAQVEVDLPESSGTDLQVKEFENFGGLIGYWNSTAELTTGDLEIINANTVLSFNYAGANNSFFTNTKSSDYDCAISNIGGIVGKSEANILKAINKADIGIEMTIGNNLHNGVNPISGTEISGGAGGTITSIMQYKYVGGIAGFITGAEITNCLNESSVYGMYAVGGLIGGTSNDISIIDDRTDYTYTSDASIIGLVDVGGVIGRAGKVTFTGTRNIISNIKTKVEFNQVAGIVDVGGIVGRASEVSIYNCIVSGGTSSSSIIGNFNVGGLVGYADCTTTTGDNPGIVCCTITDLTVYGSVFDYNRPVGTDSQDFYYLPSNIGGAVGYISGSYKFSVVSSEVNVKTDEAFEIPKGECTVNMTSNYFATSSGGGDSYPIVSKESRLNSYLNSYYGIQPVNYDAVSGGIGGFAGRLDGGSTLQCDENTGVNGDVYAYYGINVGGMVGYLDCNPSTAQLPKSLNETGINVAGKIFVGGYIGKSAGFGTGDTNFFANNTVSNINVQRYKTNNGTTETEVLAGNCVGGVIGYVKGNVYNIKIDDIGTSSPIKVFNSSDSEVDSMYVGALIGRIDGNMDGCSIAPEYCDAYSDATYYFSGFDTAYSNSGENGGAGPIENYEVQGIIQQPTIYNYGGLVGLVNVASSTSSEPVQILGTHYYPFTVDTVQNRDYTEGVTDYSYSKEGGSNVITSIAHYVNDDNFNISVSCLTDLYNKISNWNETDNHNPTNPDCVGWAKEYTLFRTLVRVIPQNESTGDSVQTLYNASYINEVYTTFSSQSGYEISDEIIYTVYQPMGQTAKLYCKYGIANEIDSFDPNQKLKIDVDDDNSKLYEEHYKVAINGDGEWEIVLGLPGMEESVIPGGREAFWTHIVNPAQLGLASSGENAGFDTGTGRIKSDYISEANEAARHVHYTFGYSYYESPRYMNNGSQYFVFDTVFGSLTRDEENTADNTWWENFIGSINGDNINLPGTTENKTLYSNSGSIFEVSGTVAPTVLSGITDSQKWLKRAAEVLIDLGLVALTFATMGGSSGLLAVKTAVKAGAKMAVKAAAKMIGKMTIKKAVVLSITIGAALGGGINAVNKGINELISLSTVHVESSFANIEQTSLGYLSSSYSRQIAWQDGYMKANIDTYISTPVFAKITRKGTPSVTLPDLTAYDRAIQKDIFQSEASNIEIENGDEVTLVLNYYNCSLARSVPANINEKTIINVGALPENHYARNVLLHNDILELEVPQFVAMDDELYSYGGGLQTGRNLVPNYEYTAKQEVNENDLINVDGYAYFLNPNSNSAYVIPDTEEYNKYLNDNKYNLSARTDKSLPFIIASGSGNIQVGTDDGLRWRVEEGSHNTTDDLGLIYNKQFKYAGDHLDENNFAGKYIKKDNHYYTLTGNGTGTAPEGVAPTIAVKLTPTLSGVGLTTTDLDISGTLYYKYHEQGYIYRTVEIGLSKYFDYPGNGSDLNLENGNIYDYEVIPAGKDNNLLKAITEKLYIFDPENPRNNGKNIEDFFTEADIDGDGSPDGVVTLLDIKNNFSTYSAYSLSNQFYNKVGDVYGIENGELCTKVLVKSYLAEEKSGITFVYSPRYESVEMDNCFNNKYVYDISVGTKTVKLYTRFKYDNFLGYSLIDIDSDGDSSIGDIILPNSASGYYDNNVVLAEGCRVTLSYANNANNKVYRDFRTGSMVSEKWGTISAYIEYLPLPGSG